MRRHGEPMLGGQRLEARHQLAPRNPSQRELRCRPHVLDPAGEPHPLIAHHQHPAAAGLLNTEDARLAVQQDRIADPPLHRRVPLRHAQPLRGDPRLMPLDERLGLAARTASRNRHPQRSVGVHSKDVLAGALDAHEMNVRLRRGLGGAQERKVQLHPMRIRRLRAGHRPAQAVPSGSRGTRDSLVAHGDQRIDGHRAPRRNVAGGQRDQAQEAPPPGRS